MTPAPEDLHGIARTLLMPLACRALESVRPDAILHDPRAVEVYTRAGGSRDFLLGVRGHDIFAAAMRVRQFDTIARDFLARQPGALLVDLGCGLDTRFERLDDGQLHWLGIDLPEVIELRAGLLPDGERCRAIAGSIFDPSWMDLVAAYNRPVLFLAEGIFPYFTPDRVRPVLTGLAARFPGSELVFDGLNPLMAWVNNLSSSVLKRTGTRVGWGLKDPADLKDWGLQLLDRWGYFDKPEARLGLTGLIRHIRPLARATFILHYRLGTA